MENTTCPTNVLESASVPGLMMLLATLIAGGIVLVICYAVSRRSRSRQDSKKTYYSNESVPTSHMYISSPPPVPMQPREGNKRAKNNKKRQAQQERVHPWMIGTLKGHTGLVNDMDFSSNGRYLASCADDESLRETRKHVQSSGHTYKKKEFKKKTSSLQTDCRESQSFTRREDKETGKASRSRTRGSSLFSFQHIGKASEEPSPLEVFTSDTSSNDDIPDESQQQMMFLNDATCLASTINKYILSPKELFEHGYPIESTLFPGYAMINNISYPSGPKIESDSGQYTNSSSSDNSEQESSSDNEKNFDKENSSDKQKNRDEKNCSENKKGCDSESNSDRLLERTCVRCYKVFYADQNGEYLNAERCVYHCGKMYNRMTNDSWYWTCCNQARFSRGCAEWKTHVWTGLVPGINGPFAGYVHTMPSPMFLHDNNYGIYAMDCEMCYTLQGLELVRVSLVDLYGQVVYDTLVKPSAEIIDFNTKFSGITEDDMSNITKTLPEVQNDLLNFIHAETILMGHSLGNDLKALRLIHKNVVDTSAMFPHYLGLPYRNGLKTLARKVLNQKIQEETHNSIEDARVVMDLVLRKAQYEWQQSLVW
ncbi:GOR Exonuclease, partial [Acromyrmex insinuator]